MNRGFLSITLIVSMCLTSAVPSARANTSQHVGVAALISTAVLLAGRKVGIKVIQAKKDRIKELLRMARGRRRENLVAQKARLDRLEQGIDKLSYPAYILGIAGAGLLGHDKLSQKNTKDDAKKDRDPAIQSNQSGDSSGSEEPEDKQATIAYLLAQAENLKRDPDKNLYAAGDRINEEYDTMINDYIASLQRVADDPSLALPKHIYDRLAGEIMEDIRKLAASHKFLKEYIGAQKRLLEKIRGLRETEINEARTNIEQGWEETFRNFGEKWGVNPDLIVARPLGRNAEYFDKLAAIKNRAKKGFGKITYMERQEVEFESTIGNNYSTTFSTPTFTPDPDAPEAFRTEAQALYNLFHSTADATSQADPDDAAEALTTTITEINAKYDVLEQEILDDIEAEKKRAQKVAASLQRQIDKARSLFRQLLDDPE